MPASIPAGAFQTPRLASMRDINPAIEPLGSIAFVEPWTHGYSAVLAVFLPAAVAFIALRTGLSYWRHRHVEDSDTGCLAA